MRCFRPPFSLFLGLQPGGKARRNKKKGLISDGRLNAADSVFYLAYTMTAWQRVYHIYDDPSAVFNAPMIPTLIALGVVVTLVAFAGGAWAVLASDFVQMFLLLMWLILIVMSVLLGCAVAFFLKRKDVRV